MGDVLAIAVHLYGLIGCGFGAWCFVDIWRDGLTDDEVRQIVSTVEMPPHQEFLRRFAGPAAGMTVIHAVFWPIVIYVLLTPRKH